MTPDEWRLANAYLVAQHALRVACNASDFPKAAVCFAALLSLWARLPRVLRLRCYLLGMQYGGPVW